MTTRSSLTAMAACLLAAACATNAPDPQPQAPTTAEPIEMFTLAIDAGRWEVIIDNAARGIDTVADQSPNQGRPDEDLSLRIDRSLKDGAISLRNLQNYACSKNIAAGPTCEPIDWPTWVLEPYTSATPPETLQQRSNWLGEALGPLSVIGCTVGKEETGDEFFCAVE